MGPNTINRENVKRKIVISANVADRDLRSVVNDIQKQIDASVQLPEGYHIEYGGQFESEQAASRTLALTSFISIVVIFLLLYHEFRSVKESGVILLNLPLALIGGVFALVLTTGKLAYPLSSDSSLCSELLPVTVCCSSAITIISNKWRG